MTPKLPRLILLALLVGWFAISNDLPARNAEPTFAGLTVHEWGTFTSFSGSDAVKLEFRPLVARGGAPA